MADIGSEWDYYLQAFRLHQGLSRKGNKEAEVLLRAAIEKASDFGRAYGLLSFTIQNRWLCNWITLDDAKQIHADATSDVQKAINDNDLPSAALTLLQNADTSKIDSIIKAVLLAYATVANGLGVDDFDNKWSLATATLYNDPHGDAVGQYKSLHDNANPSIPKVTKSSLDVDYADALFFAGDPPKSDEAAITQAIGLVEAAIADNPDDPKRHRWYWTLGWAYYELAGILDKNQHALEKERYYLKALAILHRIRNPHDLILKNIMAAFVGAGMTDAAKPIADGFKYRNPGYTLVVEDRWPYRNDAQRERWKNDLKSAGLPA